MAEQKFLSWFFLCMAVISIIAFSDPAAVWGNLILSKLCWDRHVREKAPNNE